MPKLAIYVPKKEMKELEKWRKQINFSKVFMQAVMREIRLKSRSNKKDGRVAAAAKHYKQQLAVDSGPLEEIGFELGTSHVLDCRLSPEKIRALIEIEPFDPEQESNVAAVEAALGSDIKQIDAALKETNMQSAKDAWRLAAYGAYAKGVASAWKRVCEQM